VKEKKTFIGELEVEPAPAAQAPPTPPIPGGMNGMSGINSYGVIPDIPTIPEEEIGGIDQARGVLKRFISFSQGWHYDLVLVWAAQPYLASCLPDECCVNIAFTGGISSGKTKATQIAVSLADGEMLQAGTLSALIRTFDQAKVTGIDELDSNLRRVEDLEGILRAGNKWNATYRICVPKKDKGWEPRDLRVGGPKAFNFRGEVEDGLRSRTYVLELPRQRDSRLIVNNLFKSDNLEAVKKWLKKECTKKKAGWVRHLVEHHMKDDQFIGRLDALPTNLARNVETASIFLMIADILHWPLDDIIKKAVDEQGQWSNYEDVRAALAELYLEAKPGGGDWEVAQGTLLGMLNDRRRLASLKPIDDRKDLPKIKRELGFKEGVNCVKHSKEGGKRFLIFDRDIRKAIGVPDPTNEEVLNGAIGNASAVMSVSVPTMSKAVKTIKDITDHINMKLRWFKDETDNFIARDTAKALQLPEDEDTINTLSGFIAVQRAGASE